MRKWIVVIVLMVVSLAGAQTTPNLGLQLPNYQSPNWGVALNFNFSRLDGYLSANYILPALETYSLGIVPRTYAELPASPIQGEIAAVTDSTSSTTCSAGGGSNFVLCYYTGSVWTIFGGGGGSCSQGTCVVNNPTATQTIVQPATTNLNINNFEGQLWADQYGTGTNGIETSYAQCLEQNGLGYSGCSIYVSQNYTNADAPGGWAFNSSQYSNPAMSQPAGAATYDERNGTQYWQFHDPLDPITGQATGLALTTQFDKSVADKNAVITGGSQAGNYNTVNITGGGSEFNFYAYGLPQYVGETYTYGNYTTLNDYAGGIDFLNYGYLNKRSNGDSYLFWDELTADAGILSANSEGNGVADHTAREDPLVYTGTVNGSPATGATQISITPTIGAGTQGAMYRWLVNQSTPLDSGTHFTNSVGPQTTGSATNSAIIPPSVSDSTQNFPVSTLVQLCYPGADNGASGAAGCTSGSQPIGYVPSQNYKFTITGGSVTSGVATFSISPTSPQTTPVTLVAGQVVTLYGFSLTGSGAFLNQQHVTVLSSGLSSTQFEANVTGPDTAAVGSGYSTYSPTGYSPAASITFDVVPAYTTGGETGGLPAGFCTPSTLQSTNPSSACYMPASGVGCLTDQIETECQNFTYNSGAGTITISNLQFPHLNGAVFAYGGLAGKMVEDESSKYTGGGTSGIIDEVYPIAGSLNSTTFYYVPQRTNLGYASPALGGSVDGGDGNGGTVANGTNTATQSALCFTTTMGGFSLSSGVVTFSMGGISGITGFNPYPIYSGLTLTISGTGNSTYDGNYVVANQGDAVFTYPDSGASGTVPTSGTVSYCNANYNVLDAARVASVANPSTGSIDDSFTLFPNTAVLSGTIVREPHYQQIGMNGTHENVIQFQPNVYTGGPKDNISYEGTISGPGWGFDVLNNGAASSYQGSGGTLLPPTAPYNAGGEWLNTLLLGQAPQQSVVNIGAGNSYGLSSPLSTFSLFQMPGLPNSVAGYGLDTLCYNPYYNYSNRGNALTSGEWIFGNAYGFNCLNGPADNNVVSTVRMGNLIADSSVSTASISAASMVTTALTNTPANAPSVVGTTGSTSYNYYVVGNGAVGQTLPFHMGGSPDSLTNGNATLSGTNYNLLCAFYNPGFKSYDFVKDVGGVYTAVATNVAPGNGATYGQVSNYACAADTGAVLPSYPMPTSNTTGTVQGENFVDTSMTPGTSPVCPNGPNGSLTTTGCAAGGSTVGTAGQIQMVGATAGSHAASAMTDNGTQITSTEPFSVNASTLPSQVTITYNGVSPTVGTSTSAVFAANSSGQGVMSEAGGSAARICDATNGVCAASLPTASAAGQTPVSTGPGTTYTAQPVLVGASLTNYNASNLPVTYGTTTSGSNVVTVADASSWVTGEGVYIPATADSSGGVPVGGLGCDNVTVSGNTLTMKNSDGTACNASWPSGVLAVPVIHWDVSHGAITSGTNALTVTSNVTLVNGNGIRVAGAGTAGADLICPDISVSGTTVTLLQSDGVTPCNAGTTVTDARVFHDDTQALKNALAAATFVRAPEGAYYLSSEVDITDGKYLYGDGPLQTIFISAENGINTLVLKSSGITMKDFGMFQDPGYTPTSGVLFSLCDGTSTCITDKLTRLYFYGGWDQLEIQNKAIQDSLDHSTFYVPIHTSIHYSNPSPYGDFDVSNLEIDSCSASALCNTATGILVDASDTSSWSDIKLNSFATQININAAVGPVARLRFSNISAEGGNTPSGQYNINIAPAGANAISDIQFTGGEFENGNTPGALMYVGNGVTGVQVNSVHVVGSGTPPECFDLAGQGFTLTGDVITGCPDAVRLEATATGTLQGNSIYGNTGWGINAIGTPAPIYLNGNSFSDNGSGNQNVSTYQAVDNFVGAASTPLISHYADTGQSWTAYTIGGDTGTLTLVGNGQVQANTNSADAYSSLVPSSANYTVTATCTALNSSAICATMGRMSTSAFTLYEAVYIAGTGYDLYKIVAGTTTLIGSYSTTFTIGTPYTIGLVMQGTSISATLNGTTVIGPVTDTSISLAGVAGFKEIPADNTMGNFRVATNSGLVTQPATKEYVQDTVANLNTGALTATTSMTAPSLALNSDSAFTSAPRSYPAWHLAAGGTLTTATPVGPVFYSTKGGVIERETSNLTSTNTCSVAPVAAIVDCGTTATCTSPTTLTSLTTGTTDGIFDSGALSVSIPAGHFFTMEFTAGTCTGKPAFDTAITVREQ